VLHVGVANRGTWPLRHCKADIGFVPAALVDLSAKALEEARLITSLPESACFASVEEALQKADVDCVIACVPTKYHVPVAKAAMAAGKPVLIEKGMAPDWASAQDLAATVARTPGAKAAVAQNYRYNGMERGFYRAVHDKSYGGYVGNVHMIEYTQYRVRPHPGTLTYPFASVWDMSCHHFDNLMYWFGPIKQMTAHSWRAGWSPYQHDANTSAHIVFASGTVCHYVHTHDAARAVLDIQMHGELGAISTGQGGLVFSQRPTEQFGSRPETIIPLEASAGETDLLRDFHAYITRGIEPGISVRNNLETMAACELMVRSIMTGRTVSRSELELT
jgi:predicted dehydrogenase